MPATPLRQRGRLIVLAIETILLLSAGWLAFGTLLPPAGDTGFWFYTALLAVVFAARLDTPFFSTPADSVLYAAPGAVSLVLVNNWVLWSPLERITYVLALSSCILIASIGILAIVTKDSPSPKRQRLSNALRILCEFIGTPQFIFSIVLLAALIIFHRHSARQVLVITVAWVVTVGLSPIDKGFLLLTRLRRALGRSDLGVDEGEVVAFQIPGLLLIRTRRGATIGPGDLLIANDPLADPKLALALDYVGRDEGVLLRAIEVDSIDRGSTSLDSYGPSSVVAAPPELVASSRSELVLGRLNLTGFVASETSLDRMYFEVTRDDELEEGRLVETRVGAHRVTYQIVNGLTKEEVVHQKNTYGYARAQAQKVGIWNQSKEHFTEAKWLPRSNSAVFLSRPDPYVVRRDSIGHFPGTNYPVRLKSISALVTHNTAILGILGVGKSCLSLELVERMIGEGVKVVVLDLTNQYALDLAPFFDSESAERSAETIRAAGDKDRDASSDNPEQGGSIMNLHSAISDDLCAFMKETGAFLKIYNPGRISATRQTAEPRSYKQGNEWHHSAALWSVSPVEVTRIVTEAALALVQGELTDAARVCLVYEEAHSLIPEWNAVASDSDRVATNATARAILQGRKYGLGCLVVTQRTASVTKTILNQCNTVFAMRTFDETGKDFLANYVGRDYANALPSLSERQAVLFGKASSCENPILIRVNDREAFLQEFRKPAVLTITEERSRLTTTDNATVNTELSIDADTPSSPHHQGG